MKIKLKLKKKKSNILDHINIPESTGDILDYKPFNHDFKYASYFPTPGISEAFGPYEDEDDEINFFGEKDYEEEQLGVSEESKPKVNYANKNYRVEELKKFIKKYYEVKRNDFVFCKKTKLKKEVIKILNKINTLKSKGVPDKKILSLIPEYAKSFKSDRRIL